MYIFQRILFTVTDNFKFLIIVSLNNSHVDHMETSLVIPNSATSLCLLRRQLDGHTSQVFTFSWGRGVLV